MPILIRVVLQLLTNWRAIVALVGLIFATGFSLKIFVEQLGESASKFWWIGALACVVLLGREFIWKYFALKRKETDEKTDEQR